eukprot:401119_1
MPKSIKNQIRVTKSSTLSEHIEVVDIRLKLVIDDLAFSHYITPKSIGIDTGQAKCREGEPIFNTNISCAIRKYIPTEFKSQNIEYFTLLWKNNIGKFSSNSKTSNAYAQLLKSEIIRSNIHGIDLQLSDGEAALRGDAKIIRCNEPEWIEFRKKYHMSRLFLSIPDAQHNVYNVFDRSSEFITGNGPTSTTVGKGMVAQFVQIFSKATTGDHDDGLWTQILSECAATKKPPLSQVQRYRARPLGVIWLTTHPAKLLKLSTAVNKYYQILINSKITNKNFNKAVFLRGCLMKCGFRMLITSLGVIAHQMSMPWLNTLQKRPWYAADFLTNMKKTIDWHYKLKNYCINKLTKYFDTKRIETAASELMAQLETKQHKKCLICKHKLSENEFRVCETCQTQHKMHSDLPGNTVDIIGAGIDTECVGYKFHDYLFDGEDLELTGSDLKLIEDRIQFSCIIGNEDEMEGDSNEWIYFYLTLISGCNNFVKYLMSYHKLLMSPVLMVVFMIDKHYAHKIAVKLMSYSKHELRKLTVQYINDKTNINMNNFVQICDEDIYSGFSKFLGSCELSIKLYNLINLYSLDGGNIMCRNMQFDILRHWLIDLDGRIRTTFFEEKGLGDAKKLKEQTCRDWDKARMKLFTESNAKKCLFVPSHVARDKSKKNILQSLPRPHLTASYDRPNHRTDKRPNPDNILASSLTQNNLVNLRKEKKKLKQNKPKKSKPMPLNNNINYANLNAISKRMIVDQSDIVSDTEYIYGCCDNKSCNDEPNNFELECVICIEWFHFKCLKYKFGVSAQILKMLEFMYKNNSLDGYDWKCPPCELLQKNISKNHNVNKEPLERNFDVEMVDVENNNSTRRRSKRISNRNTP